MGRRERRVVEEGPPGPTGATCSGYRFAARTPATSIHGRAQWSRYGYLKKEGEAATGTLRHYYRRHTL